MWQQQLKIMKNMMGKQLALLITGLETQQLKIFRFLTASAGAIYFQLVLLGDQYKTKSTKCIKWNLKLKEEMFMQCLESASRLSIP